MSKTKTTYVCLDCGLEYSLEYKQFQQQCDKCGSTKIWDVESLIFMFGEDWRDRLFKS
jgi:DNA-directed RNA polymerase subunit RPC12/RpoP